MIATLGDDFRLSASIASIRYVNIPVEELGDKQIDMLIDSWDKEALKLYAQDPERAAKYLTDRCCKNADGYINTPQIGQEVPYPRDWLLKVGYLGGPTSYEKPESN